MVVIYLSYILCWVFCELNLCDTNRIIPYNLSYYFFLCSRDNPYYDCINDGINACNVQRTYRLRYKHTNLVDISQL